MAFETAVKARPIVFSAVMLGAIRAGLKTQTRRVVTGVDGMVDPVRLASKTSAWRFRWPDGSAVGPRDVASPFGSEGDSLWVRETLVERDGLATYAADGAVVVGDDGPVRWRWKDRGLSCRFMPREASRLTLRVEEVRVQRLSRISAADAVAEGFAGCLREEALWRFRCLWDELHGEGAAAADPWVWALTFDVLTGLEGR